MNKRTVLRVMLTILLATTLLASFEIRETSASPTVRIYVDMPAQGYITGIPVGEILKVTVNIESPIQWRNTADGIIGWFFSVHVDPEVLEPITVRSAASGYFLYGFAQTHGHSTFCLFGIDKEAGLFIDIVEGILGYLEVGAGGDGKLCELWFESKSQTAHTSIDLYYAEYRTRSGGYFPVDIVEDGHYNSPPDVIPPTTTLTIGAPQYIDTEGNIYVTSSTPFSLTAVDDPGGVGVALTAFKVYNATWDSGWITYTAQFYLESLDDGVYIIAYVSVDYAGNVEEIKTVQVILFSWAFVDIEPYTLNLKSKGRWITAYLQLAEGYNAEDINATTILLNGTISPVLDPRYDFVINSSEYLVDHNNDGILERMVKFDRASVQSFIYNEGFSYGDVALIITGELFDGTAFVGTDIIFVNHAGDANNDGIINALDLGVINANWNPNYNSNADFNKDGIVNALDIGILNVNFGETAP